MNNTPNRITLTDAPEPVDPKYKAALNNMFRAAREESAGDNWSGLANRVMAEQADAEERWRNRPTEKARRW